MAIPQHQTQTRKPCHFKGLTKNVTYLKAPFHLYDLIIFGSIVGFDDINTLAI